jgi:hypothetical protein
MTSVISTPTMGIDFSRVDNSEQFPLGMEVQDSGGTKYVYVSTTISCQEHRAFIIRPDYVVDEALSTTTDDEFPSLVGWPQGTGTAMVSGKFCWFAVEGPMTVFALANCAADVPLYTSASAGALDDNASGTKLVSGIKLTSAVGGTSAEAPAHSVIKASILS